MKVRVTIDMREMSELRLEQKYLKVGMKIGLREMRDKTGLAPLIY